MQITTNYSFQNFDIEQKSYSEILNILIEIIAVSLDFNKLNNKNNQKKISDLKKRSNNFKIREILFVIKRHKLICFILFL